MNGQSLKTILRKSGEAAERTHPPANLAPDFSRPFVPEHWTQLYYSPVYDRLTHDQRLRYNQLFALRINEYIMVLESFIVDHFLSPLRHHRQVRGHAELVACLDVMIAEERRHFEMFLALNRRCLPGVYDNDRPLYLARLPLAAPIAGPLLSVVARQLPFLIWYVLAMEEDALHLAREMVGQPATETLGELDPVFVSVHREHMKDEARHVAIDRHLSDVFLEGCAPTGRKLSAVLFKLLMRMTTRVGRHGPGIRVIRHLVKEKPELADRLDDLTGAVLSLGGNRDYQRSLFNRRTAPIAFAIFDGIAEFEDLGRYVAGYDRH